MAIYTHLSAWHNRYWHIWVKIEHQLCLSNQQTVDQRPHVVIDLINPNYIMFKSYQVHIHSVIKLKVF